MCDAISATGHFDPRLCPLLQGLSTEEQAERMQSDPRIAACIAVVEGGMGSAKAERLGRAYLARSCTGLDACDRAAAAELRRTGT